MIKTEISTSQKLSKDQFVLSGKYNYKFKLFGIKFFDRTSNVSNEITDKNAFEDSNLKGVGFGK